MKIIKIIVWVVLLYIIRTVFGGVISVFDSMPELLLVFSVIYAFNERRFSDASYMIVICAILTAVSSGKSFSTVLLITGAASVASHELFNVMRFVPKYVRCLILILASSFLIGAAECFYANNVITPQLLFTGILPYVIYTGISSCVIYPLMAKTLFPKEKSRKLLVI